MNYLAAFQSENNHMTGKVCTNYNNEEEVIEDLIKIYPHLTADKITIKEFSGILIKYPKGRAVPGHKFHVTAQEGKEREEQ
jgi:hypothetical protein